MTAGDRPRIAPGYLALGAALYALQGVVVAYLFNFNRGYMAAGGVDDPTIAWVTTLATVPMILKFLGGPLSDRVNLLGLGHRRPYIVLGLVLQSLGLLGLTLVHPGHDLPAFAAVAVLAVTGLALYDTCCDGLVIDVTPPADRSRVQGTLVASRFVATAVCSLGFGAWLDATGTGPGRGDGVLWTCAAMGSIPLLLALILPEPIRLTDREAFDWRALGVLIRPRSLALLGFGAFYSTVAYGVEINLSPYYDRLGFGAGEIGAFASARYLGRAVGAGLLALAAARLGRRGLLLAGVLLLAATTFGQATVEGPAGAGGWGFAFGLANGWDDALFNVLCMEASDPRLAASTYALFMAVSNVSVVGGGLFASSVAAAGGRFRVAFVGAAALVLAALAFVYPLRQPAHASDLPPKPEAPDELA